MNSEKRRFTIFCSCMAVSVLAVIFGGIMNIKQTKQQIEENDKISREYLSPEERIAKEEKRIREAIKRIKEIKKREEVIAKKEEKRKQKEINTNIEAKRKRAEIAGRTGSVEFGQRSNTRAEKEITTNTANPLLFDVISTKGVNGIFVNVNVKITNNSNKEISSCYVACILKDKYNQEKYVQSHYVISYKGLAPNDYTYYEYVIDGNISNVNSVSFKILSIN